MPVLTSSRHERFAQLRSKGLSAVDAYISAGYSKSNARSNASRLSAIERFLARIKELQTAVAERVVAAQARRRSWRVELLQDRIDKAIALSQARATMYASEMGESYQFQVAQHLSSLHRSRPTGRMRVPFELFGACFSAHKRDFTGRLYEVADPAAEPLSLRIPFAPSSAH